MGKNAEIARAYFDAFDRGDLVAAAEYLDVEVDWQNPSLIGEEELRGREAVRTYWERILSTSPFPHRDHGFIEVDDRVCVLAILCAGGAGSGIELSQPCGYVLTLSDEAITRSVFFFDPAEARSAAGLADSDEQSRSGPGSAA
jgi:ketosteroid isomerase-like protein